MVFQFLAAFVCMVLMLHCLGPDAPGYPANNTVLRIHSITEKEGQIAGKIVDRHAAAEVILHIGKSVGEGEGQLRDRVGAGFSNVVAADTDTIEITNALIDKKLLNVAH